MEFYKSLKTTKNVGLGLLTFRKLVKAIFLLVSFGFGLGQKWGGGFQLHEMQTNLQRETRYGVLGEGGLFLLCSFTVLTVFRSFQ